MSWFALISAILLFTLGNWVVNAVFVFLPQTGYGLGSQLLGWLLLSLFAGVIVWCLVDR